MDLRKYFARIHGLGVLSTADPESWKVNTALYSKPMVLDDKHLVFIMGDKLTHANIRKNPNAVYLFKEDADGKKGYRFYLKLEKEISDQEEIRRIYHQEHPRAYSEPYYLKNCFLVYFSVVEVLPLVLK